MAALGLAVAAAVLAGVVAGVTIAGDRSIAQEVERISPTAQAVRAVWFGVPSGADEARPVLDREVREAFEGVGLPAPVQLVLFRESTVEGRFVGITGVDGLATHVLLRAGRMPRTCTRTRCEVLRLRGRGALPSAPGLRLVEVGRATLRTRQLFGDFLAPTDSATADAEIAPALRQAGGYHRPAPGPLVVAEGLDVLAAAPSLSRTYRTYSWVWPIAVGTPHAWEIDQLIGAVERARTELAVRSDSFSVDAPQEELRAAQHAATVAGRRLLLVGGEAAALLLAFAVLAARGVRRDLEDGRRRLTWYGARRWQLWLLTGVESAVVAIGGVLTGWATGTIAGWAIAHLAGAPAAQVLEHSVVSAPGLVLAVALAVVTTALIAVAVSLRPRGSATLGVPELVALAALLVVVVALLGGVADEERLARGEVSALLLLLLPGLIALVGAVVVARLFPLLARLVADRSRGPVSVRLAAVGLARGPGAAVVTVAFLTIAFALALLTVGYRATLERGEREQAAFRVPLDVAVTEDLRKLVRVFDAASLADFQRLAGAEGAAFPVLRVTGGAGRAEQITGVTVLGLDRGALERLGVWRGEWAGGKSRAGLGAVVDAGRAVMLRGVALPSNRIVLRVGPSLLSFAGVVETATGDFRRFELGGADSTTATTLRARVPRGSRLVSLALVPPPRLIEGGADAGIALEGAVRVDGALARELRAWLGVDGVVVRPARSGGIVLRYVLVPRRQARLHPRQPTDVTPPSVLATPRLAQLAGGPGGVLSLQIGGARVPVRVAGVVTRFPGVAEDDAVVGDRETLRVAINAVRPGAARENEVWMEVLDERRRLVEEALERAPFGSLSAVTRIGLERDARKDPLAHGTLLALTASALVALVLAALGLALAVRSDLRDDRGEFYDLEAQGASPSLLRRVVRSRALTLSVAGLVAGGLVGLALVGLVTRVVSVTARGGSGEPPLASTLDPVFVVIGGAGYTILAALLVGWTTRRAFAAPRGPSFRSGD